MSGLLGATPAPPLLELGKEALNAPSLLVGYTVVNVLMSAMAAWRDNRLTALIKDDVVERVGVVGSIGKHLLCRQSPDQFTSWCHVILLSGAELETNRQAQRIDYGMDLAAKSAARATESLGFRSPLFRRPPAACACARITVASMDSHSISGSAETASKSLSNTPCSIQR